MPPSMVRAIPAFRPLALASSDREALLPPPVVTFRVEPERVMVTPEAVMGVTVVVGEVVAAMEVPAAGVVETVEALF